MVPFEFNSVTKEQVQSLTTIREGETKLGETLLYDYTHPNCQFVLLGISEDIGPQANCGLGGAKNGFTSFLSRFVNIQNTQFIEGQSICLLGEIVQNIEFTSLNEARKSVEELDSLVQKTLTPVFKAGKIPIIIGGGHNNAYPIIQAAFKAYNQQIDVINLDPHADCRNMEGRHSGNPFSYAKHTKSLKYYTVLGLHENYNSQSTYDFLKSHNMSYTFYDAYLRGEGELRSDLIHAIQQSNKSPIGFEIDLDSIAFMPTSAYTPSGFSLEKVRSYLLSTSHAKKTCYLHLPEGAPKNMTEEKIVGKALSYLVSDFIKSNRLKLKN
jgi:formiminoglutamase